MRFGLLCSCNLTVFLLDTNFWWNKQTTATYLCALCVPIPDPIIFVRLLFIFAIHARVRLSSSLATCIIESHKIIASWLRFQLILSSQFLFFFFFLHGGNFLSFFSLFVFICFCFHLCKGRTVSLTYESTFCEKRQSANLDHICFATKFIGKDLEALKSTRENWTKSKMRKNSLPLKIFQKLSKVRRLGKMILHHR